MAGPSVLISGLCRKRVLGWNRARVAGEEHCYTQAEVLTQALTDLLPVTWSILGGERNRKGSACPPKVKCSETLVELCWSGEMVQTATIMATPDPGEASDAAHSVRRGRNGRRVLLHARGNLVGFYMQVDQPMPDRGATLSLRTKKGRPVVEPAGLTGPGVEHKLPLGIA